MDFQPFTQCPEPRCEREADHDDDYGHWYTVWATVDGESSPSHPVQWNHKTLCIGGVATSGREEAVI